MKKFLLAILVLILATAGFVFWLFEREANGVPILVYHRVNDTDKNPTTLTVADFEAQIKYLVDDGYHVISPDDLLDAWEQDKPLPSKPIVLTFDDGHADIYNNVFPIPVVGSNSNTLLRFQMRLKGAPIFAPIHRFKVDIESHTMSYKDLSTLKGDKLWNEIYGSKQAIEWALKKPAKFIAYPNGNYTVDAEETSKEVHFRAGFIEDYGLAGNDNNPPSSARILTRC